VEGMVYSMQECIDVTFENDSSENNEKRIRMLFQVKRIIDLPDASFKKLVSLIKQDMGEEVLTIINDIYNEKI
jgi:hypothetical protein